MEAIMGKILNFLTMDLFKREVKKIEEDSVKPREKKISNLRTLTKHESRLKSLKDEFELLSFNLAKLETDENLHNTEKVKQSDHIIKRLVFLKYEIDIREDLISWLT